GTTLIDQIGSTGHIYSLGTSFFPVKMITELQIPVIKGVTYTITTQTMITAKAEFGAGTGLNAPAVIGSFTTVGGDVLNSYIMGTLIGLA
ncbi:hypothetical protein, partial [Burkholderia sp. SIMBA_024]|uniref:hypothetical protein n=1 Tax=Burkholderia sp. SIMBA_024 TaxID=3085768 RepID=UPI00397A461D